MVNGTINKRSQYLRVTALFFDFVKIGEFGLNGEIIELREDINEFKNNLIGLEFSDILRKGKWLLFEIGDYYLCSHLRMEGKYFIKDVSD